MGGSIGVPPILTPGRCNRAKRRGGFAGMKRTGWYIRAMNDAASGTKKTKPRRFLRLVRRLAVWLGVLWLVCTLGFVAYAMVVNARGDAAVLRIKRMLSERDLLDLYPNAIEPELDKDGDPRDEAGTSAAYWRAAMDAQPEAGELPIPAVATVNIAEIDLRQQYHPEMVSAMRETFDSNAVFFDLINKAQAADIDRFIARNDVAYQMNGLPILGDARGVARWLLVRANLAEAEDDGEAFTGSILALLDLNKTLQLDPGLNSKFVYISIDAMARQGVTDGLSRITLNANQLDRLIKAFETRRDQYDLIPLLDIMLSSEFHRTTANIQDKIAYWEAHQRTALKNISSEDKKDLEGIFGFPSTQGFWAQIWNDATLAWCPGVFKLENTERFEQAIAAYDKVTALQGDVKKQMAYANQPDDDDDEPLSLFDIRGRVTGTIDVKITTRTVFRLDNSLATAIAALSIERYRVKNGDWPGTLANAVKQAPVDAYGQPLHYKQTADGVIVYSIGPNGLDEEGYGQDDFDKQDKYLDPDDFAVRLYDPELRNALPPPNEAILPEDDYDW